MATIHGFTKAWKNAEIIGYSKDQITGQRDVIIARHPELSNNAPVDFYAKPENGKHYNVGNRAFWLTKD